MAERGRVREIEPPTDGWRLLFQRVGRLPGGPSDSRIEWNLIDQCIWGLNIQTGETWKVRPQEGDPSIDWARVLVRRRRACRLPRSIAPGGR